MAAAAPATKKYLTIEELTAILDTREPNFRLVERPGGSLRDPGAQSAPNERVLQVFNGGAWHNLRVALAAPIMRMWTATGGAFASLNGCARVAMFYNMLHRLHERTEWLVQAEQQTRAQGREVFTLFANAFITPEISPDADFILPRLPRDRQDRVAIPSAGAEPLPYGVKRKTFDALDRAEINEMCDRYTEDRLHPPTHRAPAREPIFDGILNLSRLEAYLGGWEMHAVADCFRISRARPIGR